MDVTLLLKIAGVGMLVSVLCQILKSSGKDEQSTYVSLAGILIVLIMLIGQIGALVNTVRSTFGI